MASSTSELAKPVSNCEHQKVRLDETAEQDEGQYYTSIYPGLQKSIPKPLGDAIVSLERALGKEVWLIVQSGNDCPEHGSQCASLSSEIIDSFLKNQEQLPKKPIVLIVHSPGGYAKSAFQLARLLQSRCNGYSVIVPRYAKSAATLLALGADKVMLGASAELGPLDAQILEPGSEQFTSALNTVQALECLHTFALEALDRSMMLLMTRMGHMKVNDILPHAFRFVCEMTRPLLEHIDAVKYTSMSRALKVAEEYAVRLLEPRYPAESAKNIAARLVGDYPDHDFVIDVREANKIGLKVEELPSDCEEFINSIIPFLDGIDILGRVLKKEVQKDA